VALGDVTVTESEQRRCHFTGAFFSTTMSVSAEQVTRNTTQSFVTALVTNVILLGVQVGVFSTLKRRLERIYAPRTFLLPPEYVYLLWSLSEDSILTDK
jgi:Late exocytosis, associated with Golgi transport